MTVRVEVVTPCPHGEYRMHQIQGEGNLVLRVCDDISRRSFTGWPPEAIEAAAWVIHRHRDPMGDLDLDDNCRQQAQLVLAAAWGHITGDNK